MPRLTHACRYYCTGAASTPTQFTAPEGTYTPEGSVAPLPCSPGTYNTQEAQEACPPCIEGYFCMNFSTVAPVVCPRGHHCKEGTAVPSRCPAGTYSAITGLRNVTECLPCELGHYCHRDGLLEPTAPCSEGYYCLTGSTEAEPVGKPYGDVCPKGRYCPLGTSTPQPCPVATFFNSTGLKNVEGCLVCPER